MRRRVGAVCASLCIVGVAAALAPTPACSNHQCDYFYAGYIVGEMVDDSTWESGPLQGNWLPYNGENLYNFTPTPEIGRQILTTTAYLADVEDPVDSNPPAEWVTASGNVAEWVWGHNMDGTLTEPPLISVQNTTCAQYWVRIVITLGPPLSSGSGPDADAGVPDEASIDASPDDGASNDSADDAPTEDGASDN